MYIYAYDTYRHTIINHELTAVWIYAMYWCSVYKKRKIYRPYVSKYQHTLSVSIISIGFWLSSTISKNKMVKGPFISKHIWNISKLLPISPVGTFDHMVFQLCTVGWEGAHVILAGIPGTSSSCFSWTSAAAHEIQIVRLFHIPIQYSPEI